MRTNRSLPQVQNCILCYDQHSRDIKFTFTLND